MNERDHLLAALAERARELSKLAPVPKGHLWVRPSPELERATEARARRAMPAGGLPPWFWSEVWGHRLKGLHCIRSLDYYENESEPRWHLSVSTTRGIPTWRELSFARDALLPADVFFCVQHPPRAYWLNYHPNVLHLLELRDVGLIEQAKFEGENARRRGFNAPSDGLPSYR